VAMYGLLVLGGLIAAIVVGASRVAAALGGAPGGPGAAPAGLSAVLIVGGCAALVAFVAVGIGYLIVLIRFRAAFKHAAEQARTLEQPPV